MSEPFDLTNQRVCYFPIWKTLKNKEKNECKHCSIFWLTLYHTTKFWTGPNWTSKHLQTSQIRCGQNDETFPWSDRKNCGTKWKCWLPAFSPFPKMFSKVFFFRVIKSQDCVVKSFKKKTNSEENIINTLQQFLLFPQCFQEAFFLKVVLTCDYVVKG